MRPTLLLAIAACAAESSPPNTCGDDLPRIVIGCWQVLERQKDEAAAVATLRAYYDAGFTTYDTADIYGRSESLLGRLRGIGAEPHVHTKFVTSSSDLGEARRVNSQSREALATVPDLVAFHWWDYADKSFVRAATHLATLRDEGMLHRVAACNFDVEHLREVVDSGVRVVSNQVQFSLLDRRPENGMLAFARARQIRLACFGVVAGGWLSDAWLDRPAPPRSALRTVSMRMYKARLDAWCRGDWALFQELLRTLRRIADRHATTIANVAAAWVLHQLGDDGGWVILGVRDTSHLDEHVALLRGVPFDEKDDGEVRAVLEKGKPPVGDIWSHERGLA